MALVCLRSGITDQLQKEGTGINLYYFFFATKFAFPHGLLSDHPHLNIKPSHREIRNP